MSVTALHICLAAVLLAAPADPSARMLDAFEAGRNAAALRAARSFLAEREAPAERGSLPERSNEGEDRLRQARLVEAITLVRLKRWREAEEALARLAQGALDMGHYLPALRIQVAAAQRECGAAEALAGPLPADSMFGFQSWAQVTSCWLAAGDADRAREASRHFEPEAASEQRRAAAAVLQGRILEMEGRHAAARDSYREVTVGYPLSAAAKAARTRLSALRRRGLHSAPPTPEELMRRADNDRRRQDGSAAAALYAAIQSQASDERKKRSTPAGRRLELESIIQHAELGLAEVDLVERDYDGAHERVRRLLAATDPSVRARALYLEGDVLARLGKLPNALRMFERLLRDAPEQPFALEAALTGARLAYSARLLSKARAFATWVVENAGERHGNVVVGEDGVHRVPEEAGSAHDHGAWLMAWNERQAGAPSEVVDSYLGQIDPEGPLGVAALYWRARLALGAGNDEAAEVFVEILRARSPTSYYALVAGDLIVELDPERPRSVDLPAVSSYPVELSARPAGDPRDLLGAVVLAEHGLRSEARELLRTINALDLRGPDRVAAAWLYHHCDELHLASVVARRAAQGSRDEVRDPVLLQLAYPRPYAELVTEMASRYDLAPELLYAVMREESAFDPRAQSPRLARGLMQMIPTTAVRMAEDAEVRRFRVRELFEPETAIRLGAHYLAQLLERFDGNLVAAVASYHAGETRVAEWLEDRRHLTPDELIEDIPYESTRAYIQKVLGSYGVYRILYGDRDAPAIGITLSRSILGEPPRRIDSFARAD